MPECKNCTWGETMFLKFETQEERRAYGGSAFIEIQYCPLPGGTPDNRIVSADLIAHWDIASLYVSCDDASAFFNAYREILSHSLHNDMREGAVDLWGINYYNREKTELIAKKLEAQRPQGFETLLAWLREDPYHNGFYVLGV